MNQPTNICPLMCIAGNGGTCIKERCAWWTGTECAILCIAEALESLDTNGIIIHEED